MNEETRIVNPGFDPQNNQSVNPNAPLMPEKKGLSTGTIVAGVAGGGVVGAAAAAGAAYLMSDDEEVPVAEVEVEGEALAEAAAPEAPAAPVQQVVTHTETVRTVHEHHAPHHAQQHHAQQHAQHEQPVHEDGPIHTVSNHISGGSHQAGNTGGGTEESDVHVIGIDVVDNGQGGEAVVAYMEDRVDGQLAAVIDIEGDGTVDVLAVDENGNQHFEENEFHDVSGEGIQTMGYIESYAMEQGIIAQPEAGTQMATYEEPDTPVYDEPEPEIDYSGEQDYYTAMDDSSADYINDADTGFYDA